MMAQLNSYCGNNPQAWNYQLLNCFSTLLTPSTNQKFPILGKSSVSQDT